MSSPGFTTHFVRSHSLALRADALLCSTLAGSTGKAGPWKNSQLPCSATLKKFLHSAFFIPKVCELRFCLFFNQKSIRKQQEKLRLENVLCHPVIKSELLVLLFQHIIYDILLSGSQF